MSECKAVLSNVTDSIVNVILTWAYTNAACCWFVV